MKDMIMLASSILFGILFAFLCFIFTIFIISRFMKRTYKKYEPKVSVVIPSYNEEKNISSCLGSVFSSNYPKQNLEVIVVDDGSTDNTINIVKKYSNVKLLKQKHLGKVEALNYGIKKSSRELVVTIDADTVLDKNCIRDLAAPFSNKIIAATSGNNHVKNKNSIIGTFQNIEYHFSNLIRISFSTVFDNGIWFSGSLACYRKSAIKRTGYFKKDTMAEDQDIALELKRAGYKTLNVSTAVGHTIVPDNVKDLYIQRSRWWIGTLQSIVKNRKLFSRKSSPSILFLFVNQYWWSFYSFLSLPLIIYQINYWLPYNSQTILDISSYLFKWFSLLGPAYVLYKLPVYGISIYSIFGVLAGIMTTALSISALRIFRDKLSFQNLLAIFFYFPYTIVLNIIILISMLRTRFWSRSFYIK